MYFDDIHLHYLLLPLLPVDPFSLPNCPHSCLFFSLFVLCFACDSVNFTKVANRNMIPTYHRLDH